MSVSGQLSEAVLIGDLLPVASSNTPFSFLSGIEYAHRSRPQSIHFGDKCGRTRRYVLNWTSVGTVSCTDTYPRMQLRP